MKFSTVINGALAIAMAALPVSATSAALFSEVDLAATYMKDKSCSNVCTPPKVVTCGSQNTNKREEVPDLSEIALRDENTSIEELAKRTFLNKYPKAACSVSLVKKISGGLFEVVINFELSKWEYFYSVLSGACSWLGFTGTGCDDDYWVLVDSSKSKSLVSKWTQWSTTIVVNPQKSNGKCCLPANLTLGMKFQKSGSIFSIFTSYFKQDLTWTFASVDGNFVEFDAYSSFFASLSAREQKEMLDAPMKAHMQKRFLDFSFATSIFASVSTSGSTFQNFCWDCDC